MLNNKILFILLHLQMLCNKQFPAKTNIDEILHFHVSQWEKTYVGSMDRLEIR